MALGEEGHRPRLPARRTRGAASSVVAMPGLLLEDGICLTRAAEQHHTLLRVRYVRYGLARKRRAQTAASVTTGRPRSRRRTRSLRGAPMLTPTVGLHAPSNGRSWSSTAKPAPRHALLLPPACPSSACSAALAQARAERPPGPLGCAWGRRRSRGPALWAASLPSSADGHLGAQLFSNAKQHACTLPHPRRPMPFRPACCSATGVRRRRGQVAVLHQPEQAACVRHPTRRTASPRCARSLLRSLRRRRGSAVAAALGGGARSSELLPPAGRRLRARHWRCRTMLRTRRASTATGSAQGSARPPPPVAAAAPRHLRARRPPNHGGRALAAGR